MARASRARARARAPQGARVAQRHELLGEPCQHQARVAHHGQQHLAQRLRLSGVEAGGGRPVAWQSERTEALQGLRHPQRLRADHRGQGVGRTVRPTQGGARDEGE